MKGVFSNDDTYVGGASSAKKKNEHGEIQARWYIGKTLIPLFNLVNRNFEPTFLDPQNLPNYKVIVVNCNFMATLITEYFVRGNCLLGGRGPKLSFERSKGDPRKGFYEAGTSFQFKWFSEFLRNEFVEQGDMAKKLFSGQ